MGMIDRSTRRIRTSGRLANAGVTHELALYSYAYGMWKPGVVRESVRSYYQNSWAAHAIKTDQSNRNLGIWYTACPFLCHGMG